jgi:tRNA (cmo5U34)-methyltransferase
LPVSWLLVSRDNLFEVAAEMPHFEFNQAVTDVFDDMLNRSVPFYKSILNQIAELIEPNPKIYDLGCSLGGLIPFLKHHQAYFQYIGIDKSPEMITKAKQHESDAIHFLEGDISQAVTFSNPTAIICNLVLQFIDPIYRESCIQQYYNELPDGGQLFIVEKVHQDDAALQVKYRQNYHAFKAANGYSINEINNKDKALENVLITKPANFYLDILRKTGFKTVDIFFKWYNFIGFIAVK